MQILGHDVQIIRYGTDKHVYVDGKFDSHYAASTSDNQIFDDLKWIIKRENERYKICKQMSGAPYGFTVKAGATDESND